MLAPPGDFIWSADSKVPITGYGTVSVSVQTPQGNRQLCAEEAAFCPTFICNVMSLDKLKERGYWWDTRPEFECVRNRGNDVVANVPKICGQYVLEYIPIDEDDPDESAALQAHYYHPSRAPVRDRMPKEELMQLWHLRLGHPSPEALQRLTESAIGVKFKGPITV